MMLIRKFLSKCLIAIFAICLALPASGAESSLAMPDIGDFGMWATENNRQLLVGQVTNDLEQFQGNYTTQLVDEYVPIEAKVGLAFMNAMSYLADILDSSLVRFAIIFILIAYAFWIMAEAYQMMTKTSDVKKLTSSIVKKGVMIAIWLVILGAGPAQVFMWIMGPVISVGAYVSDLILGAVTQTVGVNLPDTCAAIRDYAIANVSSNSIIDGAAAADMMCVPTRMSGFCYTAIAAGFKWMLAGLGTSFFTFIVGIVFVVLFIIIAWRFAFMALGVIADLFLTVFMLPFTAIAETIGQTSYSGIAGGIFNGFLALFNAEKLDKQITRFINAALYFVSLAIVVAFCTALLSGTVSTNLASDIPTIENQGFWITLLTAALVWWFADKAKDIAKKLGGEINDSVGSQVKKDVETVARSTYKKLQDLYKAIKESK